MAELEEVTTDDLADLGFKLREEPAPESPVEAPVSPRKPFSSVEREDTPELLRVPLKNRRESLQTVYPDATQEDFERWRTESRNDKALIVERAKKYMTDEPIALERQLNAMLAYLENNTIDEDFPKNLEVVATLQKRIEDIKVRGPYVTRPDSDIIAEMDDYAERIEALEYEGGQAGSKGQSRKAERLAKEVKGLQGSILQLQFELDRRGEEEFRKSFFYEKAWDNMQKSDLAKSQLNFNRELEAVQTQFENDTAESVRYKELVKKTAKAIGEAQAKRDEAKRAKRAEGGWKPVIDTTIQTGVSYGP